MEKYFNTAGPMKEDLHYVYPPLKRWDTEEIIHLINQQKYFVLHAPRQTGKTTAMCALMDHLNEAGDHLAAYANLEIGQPSREDIEEAMPAMFSVMGTEILNTCGDSFLKDHDVKFRDTFRPSSLFYKSLGAWAKASDKPIVLFLDEVDALVGDTLISLLRQLRAGYRNRPGGFPASIVLCGVRDLLDYRIHASSEKTPITGGSAFNVKAKSLRLGDFERDQVDTLYRLHTEETGQPFEEEALAEAWRLTEGQPWLCNALAYEVTWEMRENRDRTRLITASMVRQAAEQIIQRRETHLDQLSYKLQEERVRRVVHPILSNENDIEKIPNPDIEYCVDLGLVKRDPVLRIANPMYREVVPRWLVWGTETFMTHDPQWFVRSEDGRLDMARLIESFQQFFREQSDSWIQKFEYHEAGPQLLLQAYLQRIVNGGGRINREYGLGRKRTDLFIEWPVNARDDWNGEIQRVVMELKLQRPGQQRAAVITGALPQTADYADRCDADEAHLLVFDRDPDRSWDDRIFHEKGHQHEGRDIQVWGM